MRNVVLSLCVVAGMACGVGLSVLVGRSAGSDPEAPPENSGIGTVTSAPRPVPATARDEGATLVPVGADVSAPESLGSLLEEFPVKRYERGDGRITGSVAMRDGTPVPEVRVTAVVWGTTPGVKAAFPHDTELLPYILREVDQYHYDRALLSSAWSDEEGRFEIDGIRPDRDYHLQLERENWTFISSESQHVTAGKEIGFLAFETAPVTVQFMRADGSLEQFGRVTFSESCEGGKASGYRLRWNWDGRTPTVRQPVELPYLSYRSTDGVESKCVEMNLVPGQAAQISLTLEESMSIRGVVLGDTLDRSRDMRVVCVPFDPAEPELDPSEFYSRPGVKWGRLASGRFRFRSLGPGSYHVLLWGGWGDIVDQIVVSGTTGVIEATLDLPPLNPSDFLVVHALGPGGQPALGVQFQVSIESPFGRNRSSLSSKAQAEGSYWLDLAEATSYVDSSDTTSRWVLQCNSPEFGSATVEVTSDTRDVTVQFDAPALVEVELVGIEDWRLRNRLRVKVRGDEREVDPIGLRDKVLLGPVAPGETTVLLTLQESSRGGQLLTKETVQVQPGLNEVQITCPPLYRVVFEMPVGRAGETVTLYRNSPNEDEDLDRLMFHSHGRAVVSPEGRALFRFVLGGAYMLDDMEVVITGNAVIPYRVIPMRALGVTVRDESGVLSRWGLQSGDRIVAIDGWTLDFEQQAKIDQAFRKLLQKGSVRLAFERAGRTFTLEVENEEQIALVNLGGELRPVRD